MPLAFRVKELREARGWTQAELAERASLRAATLNRIENNRTSAISLDVLERIANALEVEPGFCIVRIPDPEQRGGTRRRGRAS